ncbi:MAG: hypothetical protein ACYDFT_07505 [Thermoplasmata archaeon]
MVSGAGDALDGVLATLLGGGVAPMPAARLATYWLGDAAIRLSERLGYGLIATDLIEELPHAFIDGMRPRTAGAGPKRSDRASERRRTGH